MTKQYDVKEAQERWNKDACNQLQELIDMIESKKINVVGVYKQFSQSGECIFNVSYCRASQ